MGSGFKAFTAASVLTAADLNNFCQNQSVMYFSSTGSRDVAITAPVDGMTAYIGSNDANEGLYTYNGTAWRQGPGWNAPWGVVGVGTATGDNIPSAVSQTSEKGLFIASKNSNKYHWPWCSWAKKIKAENQIWFQTEAEAQAAGYSPCACIQNQAPAGYKP